MPYPQQQPKGPAPEPDLLDLADHQNFLDQPKARALVKQLTTESDSLVTALLNDFGTMDEIAIKVVLQRIKTQRHILKCLTTPMPLPR